MDAASEQAHGQDLEPPGVGQRGDVDAPGGCSRAGRRQHRPSLRRGAGPRSPRRRRGRPCLGGMSARRPRRGDSTDPAAATGSNCLRRDRNDLLFLMGAERPSSSTPFADRGLRCRFLGRDRRPRSASRAGALTCRSATEMTRRGPRRPTSGRLVAMSGISTMKSSLLEPHLQDS